jgi:hypothetical protein
MALITINNCCNCGVAHEWIFEGLRLKELRSVKKLTGLNGMAFEEAAEQSDPEALAALIWILHKRDKITIPFDDVDLDFTDFDMAETEDERQAREAAEAQEKALKGKGPAARNGRPPRAA